MAEELDTTMTQEPQEIDVQAILRDYHKRQLVLHMIGPIVSLLVHVIVLGAIGKLYTTQRYSSKPPVEVELKTLETVELDKPVLEELEKLPEEDITTDAPPMDAPEAPVDSSVADSAVETIGDDAPSDTASFDDLSLAAEADVAAAISPLQIAGVYSNRTAAGRAESVRRYSGTKASQDAVERALEWLQSVQRPNGSWMDNSAHSGLALLVFLAHGETPLSEKYGRTVQNAMKWLADDMMRVPPGRMSGNRAYSHGIATYALAEAYGLTQIPFLRSAMEKGLDVIIRGQQAGGGFNYRYDKGDRWDLSVGGWQVQALKAGIAAGATNPGLHEAAEKSMVWIRDTTYKNGKFGYSSAGSGGNMTGVGAVCLQLLGETRSKETLGGCETIATERLNHYNAFLGDKVFEKDGSSYIYGWYYDTQAMFNLGGRHWKAWAKVFQKVLTRSQHSEGYWEFTDERSHYGKGLGGQILVTCWCTLQLEVFYRYLPTFDISKMQAAPRKSAASALLDDSDLIIR